MVGPSGVDVPDALIIEREAELRVAGEVVARASAGKGATVLIEGAAGVGKTTVIEMFAEAATERGMAVLGARATPVEQSEAWALVKRLFDRLLHGADGSERERLLSGAALNAVPALGLANAGAPVIDSFTCIHGLYWLIANVAAEEPLLLHVDDVQWADTPSARWLAHMSTRSADLPLALVIARRSGEPAAAAASLDDLEGAEGVHRVRPAPLSAKGSEVIVRARLGAVSSDVVTACHEATDGNPFLLREMCASVAEGDGQAGDAEQVSSFGLEGVARSLRRRLERLGSEASALAGALSVSGEGAELAEAAAMAKLTPESAARALDRLVGAEILETGPLRFRHPVLRTALYEALGRGERSRRHREVAAALHDAGADAERIASHLLLSDPMADEWVVERLADAAAAVSRRGASELAAEYLRRALAEPPEPIQGARLRFRHALARVEAGGERAITDLKRAVDAVPDDERAEAALESSRALGLFTEHEAALDVCASVPIDETVDPAIASRLSDEMMAHMLPVGPQMWPGTDPEQVMAAAVKPPDEGAVALRDISTALAAVKRGDPVDVKRLIAAVPGLIGEFPSLAFAAAGLGLVWCDELETADVLTAAGLQHSRSVGSPTGVAQWSSVAAARCLRAGEIAQGFAHASASVEFNLDRPAPTLAWPLAPMIECLTLRGELDEASRAADLVPDRTDGYLSTATLTESVGRLALARGETGRAVRLFEDAGRRFDSMGFAAPPVSAWRGWLAEALVLDGERERATELASEQLEIALRAKTRRGTGEAQRALAHCTEPPERAALLREAVETLRGSPARVDLARALIDLGAEVRRSGSPRSAREPLAEAMRIAQACGAAWIEKRARDELVASGARPRRRALSGLESLTPSELRVAGMVASGLTNREAAQALFVSEKTVEGHLRSIFRKLEIGSRTEIKDRLHPATG